jgi:hypothetical protein
MEQQMGVISRQSNAARERQTNESANERGMRRNGASASGKRKRSRRKPKSGFNVSNRCSNYT